ncbi:hypothetical protein [Streptomyces sp. NPDC059003]|uniref:hypothetical protein n=1 Tax=Streptomyces sp. NPDC059003 TaxID=3346691 RepID=UPI00368EA12F
MRPLDSGGLDRDRLSPDRLGSGRHDVRGLGGPSPPRARRPAPCRPSARHPRGRRLGHRRLAEARLRGLRLAPRALGTGHQQQVVVLGGILGGVEEGVRVRGGDARLLHHACALRQSLARDLAGVGHAYPSPIG